MENLYSASSKLNYSSPVKQKRSLQTQKLFGLKVIDYAVCFLVISYCLTLIS
jgi:hypothetical protein